MLLFLFIHLPPTLYNVFLPVLLFSLLVSFQQYSILIHSSSTDNVRRFFPSASVSPLSITLPMLHSYSFIYHRRCIMFFSQYFSFLVNIIPAILHTHSFIYHRHCIMFSLSTSVFPVSIILAMLHTHSFIFH